MDHIKVLKRAWEITWRYRVLWVFGIIVALTTGGGVNRGSSSFREDLAPGGEFSLPAISEVPGTLIAIGVGLVCVIIILAIAAAVARYVAETALIRMVDDYEETGEQHRVRQGFRIGWSRTAWRLFLINLLTNLPVMLALFLLLLLGLVLFLLLTAGGDKAVGVIAPVMAIGLGVLLILLAIVASAVLSLLRQFFWRVCALKELGVIESIRQGFDFVRQHLKDVVILWLIMVGLGIAWIIVMIPVTIALVIMAAIVGGVPALLVGGLASLAFEEAVPWILAGAVGLPIFILTLVVPLTFLGGLAEVFKSSVWTLTYRELRALEGLEPEELETEPGQLPELDAPGLDSLPDSF